MIPLLVVPTLTRKDLLYRLLDSIDYPVARLLVIDNGGQDLQWLQAANVEQISVADLRANLGVAASWNLAIRNGYEHDYVLIVSDDVIFPPGALEAYAQLASSNRVVLSQTWPHWCAFAIGMQVVSRVGLFDERFYPAYFEDTDYLARLDAAGIETTTGPEVVHANSSTLQTAGAGFETHNTTSFAHNRDLYEAKQQYRDEPELPFDPYLWRALSWT